jgi:decaprenylphospho-beta-D-erythro-pentofuranosid-2-ulose 2-reductase
MNSSINNVVIVGATSAIAIDTARLFAKRGASIVLCGRNTDKLNTIALDIRAYGATTVNTLLFDAGKPEEAHTLLQQAEQSLGRIDAVLVAHGSLPDQSVMQDNPTAIISEFTINALSVMTISEVFASYFEKKGQGCLAVISSVAGDRGRQSNYNYGSAKGAVSIYLQGLRNRLAKKNINVVTIKPGFVDTPMTAHLPKNALFASSASVGKDIHSAMMNGKDVVYTPFFWRFIMLIIKSIPEFIFKKLSL